MSYDDGLGEVRQQPLPPLDARAAAIASDALIVDFDWSRPHPDAVPFRFEAPSGTLAGWSIGSPADPRVVLVPGVTGSKEDFVLLGPLLAKAGYFVQSFDIAGQFESADAGPSRLTGRYDLELYVADLIAFLRSGEPAHLLGYSFAGIVAQLVVARNPQLVRSLTLLTTPPLTGQVFRSVKIIGPISRFVSARVGAGLMIWGIMTNKNGVGPQRLDFVQKRMPFTKRQSVDDIVEAMMHTPDVRAAVADSGVPVLIATGEHDLWPVREYAEYADQLDARLAVYRTGHSPCETTPHQLALDMLILFEKAKELDA